MRTTEELFNENIGSNEKHIQIWSKEIGTAEILAAYKAECREISRQCEEEGYPSYGENYELRADNLWEEWYEEPFRLARIREKMKKIRIKKAVFHSRKEEIQK